VEWNLEVSGQRALVKTMKSVVMRNRCSFDSSMYRPSNQIDNIDSHAFTVNNLCWLHSNISLSANHLAWQRAVTRCRL
jgi:hypothetical protein